MKIDLVRVKLCKENTCEYNNILNSPESVVSLIKDVIDDSDREMFVAIAMNVKNVPVAVSTISIGTLNAALITPRELFKFAILANAGSIIISHNHPSGNCNPSSEDDHITERLVEAGKIIGIKILDHLIVCDNEYYSYCDQGVI